jgi:hypothetical protein
MDVGPRKLRGGSTAKTIRLGKSEKGDVSARFALLAAPYLVPGELAPTHYRACFQLQMHSMDPTANSFRSFAFASTCRTSSPLIFAKAAPPPMNSAPGSKQVSGRRSSRQTAHS